jgi:Bacterial SH3 domain.
MCYKRKEGIFMKKIKVYVAAVLSLCMVLAGSMTAFAAEAGQQPEEPVLAAGSARIFILPDYENSSRTVTGDGVRLRAEPGNNGSVVGLLYKGNNVYLSGEAEIVDGITWLRVLQSPSGAGWIAKNFVQ